MKAKTALNLSEQYLIDLTKTESRSVYKPRHTNLEYTTDANQFNREPGLQNLQLMSQCEKNSCPVVGCGKKFKYSSSLVHHMKIHQGIYEH